MAAAPVLDSYALIAFLRGEPGEEQVAKLLEKAGDRDAPLHMTEVNYAEVKYSVIRKDGAARWEEIEPELPTLPIQFHPADRRLADLAAAFWPSRRGHVLTLDRRRNLRGLCKSSTENGVKRCTLRFA